MVLFVALFTIGCAHKTTPTISLPQTVPSFEMQQLTVTANTEKSPSQLGKVTLEQSLAQSKAVVKEKSPTEGEEKAEEKSPTDSEEVSEDLSDEDLDFEDDLDFLDEEGNIDFITLNYFLPDAIPDNVFEDGDDFIVALPRLHLGIAFNAVPEPSTGLLVGFGLIGIAGARRRL